MSSRTTSTLPGLEDNPANYDGHYNPHGQKDHGSPAFETWQIYPPPPIPHWKERDPYAEASEPTSEIAQKEAERRKFDRSKVTIPGRESAGRKKRYEIDSNGVYQVYKEGVCDSCL